MRPPRQDMLPLWLRPTLLVGLALCAAGVITDGTWGAGDTITHYLFARHAWAHPALFIDHWAKPVFTVLASPFAQYGFVGMKIFQSMVIAATAGSLWLIQAELKRPMPWLPLVLLAFCPDVIMASQSGLTEPTFALVLALGVLLLVRGQGVGGALALSMLPFCRTEGFLLIPVFALYMATGNGPRWHVLLLAAGTVVLSAVYAISGHHVLHVFTANPYAVGTLKYGSGPLSHFIVHLLYVLGLPVYVLFWLGLLAMGRSVGTRWRTTLLFVGPVLVLIGAHSVFWWRGLFGSGGLSRVLIAIAPLCAIIASEALIVLREMIDSRWDGRGRWAVAAGAAYVIIFPFTPNHASLQLSEFTLTPLQERIVQANTSLAREGLGNRPVIGSEPYWWMVTDSDPFAEYGDRMRPFARSEFKQGDIVAWDNWLGPINAGISYQSLVDDPQLRPIAIYGDGTGLPMLAIFEVQGPQ